MNWDGFDGPQVPFRRLFRRLERPLPADAQVVTAYTDGQVTLRSNRAKIGYHEAATLAHFRGVEPGDFVVHGLDILRGSVGISESRGAISSVCTVCLPIADIDVRYMAYVVRLQARSGLTRAMARGVREGGADFRRWDTLGELPLPIVSAADQRRIADFLDDRVSRIDRTIAARHGQLDGLEAVSARHSFTTITGVSVSGRRRDSGQSWLGSIPQDWSLQTVGSHFEVQLGKMLNESRQTGDHSIPYLRNTNVQWDRIDTDDVKSMDIAPHELARYTVRRGDLLICEGGQPGRAAIWDGRTAPMGFQKALHRARSRGATSPQWLLECLRVATALKVFAVENGQTTIGHLTNEQLRAQRFPFPSLGDQEELLKALAERRDDIQETQAALTRSIELLTEYKQSLITAAVTGQLDVTTASTRIPE